ncbi:MAG: phage baseplate assembly protein V [Desulfovibrio sp.]
MSQHPKLGYSQQYRGQVVSVSDPKRELRVQVRVFDFFDGVPDADLPWATYNLPVGVRPGDGFFIPVKVGDYVWVDFLNGDTRHPRIISGLHQMPGGVPNLPPEAFEGGGQFEHKRTDEEPKPDKPGYHEDITFKQNGVLIQLTQSGAMRFTNCNSGTAVEVTKDGELVFHCEKDIFMSATGNCLMDIKGNYELKVGGSATMTSTKNMSVGSSKESLNFQAAKEGKMIGPGGLSFTGPASFSESVDVAQTVHAGGDIKSDGSIIDTGGNTNHHSH